MLCGQEGGYAITITLCWIRFVNVQLVFKINIDLTVLINLSNLLGT